MKLLFYNADNKLIATSKKDYIESPPFIKLMNKSYKQVQLTNVYVPFKSMELFSIEVEWQGT